MERRRLGHTDIELSVIGLGTWVAGGRWGGADDAASLAAAHAAVDGGVNWIDTADIYGQGRAEKIVAQVLRDRPGEVMVATKGGVAWAFDPDFRIWRVADGAYLRQALEASLERLGVEAVDIYQVHWPVPGVDPTDTMGTMDDLRREGKIRAVGVSNYALSDLQAAHAAAPLDSYQPGYHLLRRDIEGIELGWCAANDVGVIAYGPLGHGLFTGKMTAQTTFGADDWRSSSELFTDDAFADRIAIVEALAGIAEDSGRAGGVAELAVAWVLRRPEITAAIVGARDPEQARANLALADTPLTADEDEAIEAVLARYPDAGRHYGHGEPPASDEQ